MQRVGSKRLGVLSGLVLAALCVSLGLSTPVQAQTPAPAVELSPTDCAKCHELQPAQITAKGGKHRDQINCQDCHTGHRPKVANNIPECNMCHGGKPHYEVKGCLSCHNPHQPKEVTLKGELKAVCLTCHIPQNEQLEAHKSKHTTFACNFCHADRHGVIPECVQCHKSHSADMAQKDCGSCHKAHMPLMVAYGSEIPSNFCGACHTTALSLLTASKAKHKDVACVTCHQDKHKMVPQCSDCHGLPHPDAIHSQFPKCGQCHNIAHDLNNWPSQKKADAKAAPAKGAKPKKGK